MALPSTGSISMAQVRTELGLSGAISLNLASVRTLAGKPSGVISMSDLRGKSANTVTSYVAYVEEGWNPTPADFAQWTMNITFSDGSRIASASSTATWLKFILRSPTMLMYSTTVSIAKRSVDVVFTSTTGLKATYRFNDYIGQDDNEQEGGTSSRRIYPTKIG